MKTLLRTMPVGEPANANTEAEAIPDPIEHERVVKLIALGMFTGGLNVYQQLLMGGHNAAYSARGIIGTPSEPTPRCSA